MPRRARRTYSPAFTVTSGRTARGLLGREHLAGLDLAFDIHVVELPALAPPGSERGHAFSAKLRGIRVRVPEKALDAIFERAA